eukprot:2611821-Ditylum_brightwellii.AAC.1
MDYPHGFGPQAWLTSQAMGCTLLTQSRIRMPLQSVMDPMKMITAQQPVLLKQLCTHHNINSGAVTIACNGKQALLKRFDLNTSLLCQSSQQDLIRATGADLKNSPFDWKWQH